MGRFFMEHGVDPLQTSADRQMASRILPQSCIRDSSYLGPRFEFLNNLAEALLCGCVV